MRRPSRAKPDFPCKTGLSNYSREKFLGPHTDLNTGFFSQDRNDGSVPTHVGEGGRFTSEFGERGLWVAASGATGGAVERKKKEAKKKENEEARGNCRRYGKNQNAIRQLLG